MRFKLHTHKMQQWDQFFWPLYLVKIIVKLTNRIRILRNSMRREVVQGLCGGDLLGRRYGDAFTLAYDNISEGVGALVNGLMFRTPLYAPKSQKWDQIRRLLYQIIV
ncbi:hypothetical protein BJV78DRAFT_1232506 [Lactifluus subvellereus]|nr:hypothetical protein BJV78DRAFT_1232506 [Lactifluus subvellereus]